MSTELEQQISSFRQRREQLAEAIESYRDWLDLAGGTDALQYLRFYRLVRNAEE